MDHFKKTRRAVLRNTQGLEMLALQSPHQAIKPLRLRYNQVCELLNVSRDYLRKISESDESFPKAIKSGTSRQAAVYFDTEEIEAWYQKEKERCRSERI